MRWRERDGVRAKESNVQVIQCYRCSRRFEPDGILTRTAYLEKRVHILVSSLNPYEL